MIKPFVEPCQIPITRVRILIDIARDNLFAELGGHTENFFFQCLTLEEIAPFAVNHLALLVQHVVIFQ